MRQPLIVQFEDFCNLDYIFAVVFKQIFDTSHIDLEKLCQSEALYNSGYIFTSPFFNKFLKNLKIIFLYSAYQDTILGVK